MSDEPQTYEELLDETVAKLDVSLAQQKVLIGQQRELIDQKHELLNQIASLRTSNRTLRAILSGIVGIMIVGAVAIILAVAGLVSVHHTVQQQDVDRIVGCQVRNSNTKQLVDSQLEESLANVDSLVATLLPTSQDPNRLNQLGAQWKARITQEHQDHLVEIKFVDCNNNNIAGDPGDFPPVTPPPGT